MIVAYLAINQAWVILLGDNLIDLDGQRLFSSKNELILALKEKQLLVNEQGLIYHG